jgi:hypothetical protein
MVGQVSPWRIGTITHGFEANKGTELNGEDDSHLSLCQSQIQFQLPNEGFNLRVTQDVHFILNSRESSCKSFWDH